MLSDSPPFVFQEQVLAEESINLKVTATTAEAQKALSNLVGALGELGGALTHTQSAVQRGSSGLLGVLQHFYHNASMGQQGLSGLINVIGSINPVAGLAINGVMKLAGALTSLKAEAVQTLSAAQSLTINLESLAAQELVKAGEFENAAEALDTAKLAAKGLLREIQLLGLESPFENSLVVQTFQQGMAYGFNAEQAMQLTKASLDMAAGLGKSGHEMAVIGMVMGQIRSTGKLLTQDLRQLQSRGINLADMLQSDLGVSVAQFNAGLASGKYTMDDLLDVFARFAETNFAGAGERMARTFQGIQSTLRDLKETAYITLLKQPFDQITAVMAEGLDVLVDFVTQSGTLEKIGAKLSTFVANVIAIGRGIVEWVKPGLTAVTGVLQEAFRDVSGWAWVIKDALRQVGEAVWSLVKPALDWLSARIAAIDWTPMVTHLRDTVNAVGQIIYSILAAIRRVLTGSEGAFDPLRQAVVSVLAWVIMTWDRFAAGAITWGWNLVVQIANGIIAAAKSVLQSAMAFLGNMIGLFIKPGSPPKKGPLSHILEWGKGLINTYVQAFKTADFGLLKESLQPVQQALQDAVKAGTIGEAESPEIFKAVREDVALLIAEYRKTGVVSDEVLGRIGERLGEGGAELTKYLRLQLQFQKAQDALAKVSEEVAAAEKAGFVPQALAQKLKAAQKAAGAAKDELDWQKEYLGLQKDSVDIQLQMVSAMEKLAKAMAGAQAGLSGQAGGGEDAAKVLKGGAGAALPVAPFASDMMAGLGEIGEIDTDLEQVGISIRGVSEEFGKAKEKAEAWLDAIERFVRLPLVDKLREIATALGFGSQFQKIEDFIRLPFSGKVAAIKEQLEQLTGLDFDAVLAFFDPQTIKARIAAFFTGLPALIGNLLGRAWVVLQTQFPLFTRKLWTGVMGLVSNFMAWLRQNAPGIGKTLGEAVGKIAYFVFNLVVIQLPLLALKLIGGLLLLVYKVDNWLRTEGPGLAKSWWAGFQAMVDVLFTTLVNEGPKWIAAVIEFVGNFVVGFIAGFAEHAPDWYAGLWEAGALFVQKLKDAIANAWDMVTDTRNRVKNWIINVVLQFGLWIARVKELGGEFVAKIKAGIDAAWDFLDWIKGKFITLAANLAEGAGAALASVAGIGKTFVTLIKTGFENEWDAIEGMGFGPWIVSKVTAAVTTLANNVSTWATAMYEAGEDLIQGLIDGIKAAARNLLQAFIGVMGELPEWAQKLLGINSPSTLFRGYGQNIVQGLVLGLQDYSGRLSRAVQHTLAMNDLNGLLSQQLRALRLNAPGIGVNIQQSYTFGDMQFPGVRDGRDAQGIARQLAQLTLQGQMVAKTSGAV